MKRKLTSAETEYVFDYFIKDYLGNVRAVITSEDALYTDKFLATMEDVHAVIEEENFDNLNETREDLPTAYPVDGSVYLNERIASLSAENGTEMGPSLVMPVKKGDKISLSTSYFYEEDAPGTTYQNMDFFLNEILLALASSGSGVLNLGETQLINMASGGDQTLNNSIMSLLSTEFDTTDVDKPHAYLVWMLYDQNMNFDVANSGAAKVENPNSLETLLRNDLDVGADGYLHAYVSNGSEAKVNFDNFLVQYQRGKLRQINDYYPYGLTIAGINSNSDEYLNKYTSKELQTGEFDPSLSTGLEMFDFGSRFYDPQLGRWSIHDPAEQFHNPYLGIGNNPVIYSDPNGQWAFLAPMIKSAAIGFGIGGGSYLAQVGFSDGGFENFDGRAFMKSAAFGALSGAASFGIGELNLGGLNSAAAHAASQGLITKWSGGDFQDGAASALFGSITSTSMLNSGSPFAQSKIGNLTISGITGGLVAKANDGNFWQGAGTAITVAGLNHLSHLKANFDDVQPPEVDRIIFDGQTVKVIDVNGNVIWEGYATSGSGEHMNNPGSQDKFDLGPIPEGEYKYSGNNWNSQSPARQLYNIIAGNGDWGDFNVRLIPVSYDGPRHSFFLHGGKYPGSAGCIDAGNGVKYIRNLTFKNSNVKVIVNYGMD